MTDSITVPEVIKKTGGSFQKDVEDKIRGKAPFYTPEWSFEEEGDFGAALSKIFASMSEIAIKRLNDAPQKHFLSFLETINASLLPAQSARVPLTFLLSKGTAGNVFIPALTRASAAGPDGKPVIFETEKNIAATPSKLVAIYSTVIYSNVKDTTRDDIFDHTSSIDGKGMSQFFTGSNRQEHVLYIGEKNLLNVKKAKIVIEGLSVDKLADPGNFTWEYSIEDKELKKVNWETLGFEKLPDGKLCLNKDINLPVNEVQPVSEIEVNGIKSRWIRCRVKDSKITAVKDIEISGLAISTSPGGEKSISIRKVQGIGDTFYNKLAGPLVEDKIETVDKLIKLTPEKLAARLGCSKTRAINILEAAKKSYFDKTGGMEEKETESTGGIDPDLAFASDVPIDPTKVFFPFGTRPQIYSTLYIACEDAFSKKGYQVTLEFDLKPGSPDKTENVPQISWEYWDGKGWGLLEIDTTCENKDIDVRNLSEDKECTDSQEIKRSSVNSAKSDEPSVHYVSVTIKSMPEVKPVSINGKENYWIRIRLVGGNYGKEFELVDNYVNPGKFCPPEISNLKVHYSTGEGKKGEAPEYISTINNLTNNFLWKKTDDPLKSLKPFVPLPDATALYFGFDMPLKGGPISIFVLLEEKMFPEDFHPKIVWECLPEDGDDNWKELDISDETGGFLKSGMVQLTVPDEIKMKKTDMFGLKDRYWVRAVVKEDIFETASGSGSLALKKVISEASKSLTAEASIKGCEKESDIFSLKFAREELKKTPPVVMGLYLNSIWAIQARTITGEIIGSSSGEAGQVFYLMNAPAINESIWVNEFTALSESERKDLLKDYRDVEEKKDSEGNVTEFWVKWQPKSDLIDSKSNDRHFLIDRTAGEVRFGDGKNGMVPPIGRNNIKTTYGTGGGKSGNLSAESISKLQSSIAFVDKVSNPFISDGGTDTEEIGTLIKRAPSVLRHRGKAVALSDFEWLAKEASRKVVRVKVLPNFNAEGKFETGIVTVIIVPESLDDRPAPSPELRRRVEAYLNERCPNVTTLHVIPPSYVKINISVRLITKSIDALPVIEQKAKKVIAEFLHPLKGGAEGKGWSFGAAPCVSDIYSLFESIENVAFVNRVIIGLEAEDGSKAMELTDTSGAIVLPEYALPCSGDHNISVKWEKEKG